MFDQPKEMNVIIVEDSKEYALQIVHDIKLEALFKLSRMGEAPLDAIMNFVVEECQKISESQIAFVGFLNEDETIIDTHLWVCKTMDQCTVEGKPIVNPVDKEGLLGKAIRQKKPFIINTYTDNYTYKKVCPEDRVPIKRFMAVPVMEKGHVVLVAGLANKEEPYKELDAYHISLLLEGMWNLIQRRKVEEQYRVEKERLSILTENAPFGLVTVEKDGKFSYINPKFTEITGYEISDIPSGKDWFRMAYPDASYRHEVISVWLKDLETTRKGEQRPRIFMVTCKDGTQKIINFIPVLFEDGRNMVTIEDITPRKKTEETLRESEEKYRGIFENAVMGIFRTTPDGRYLSINPAGSRMYGYESQEEMMRSVTDMAYQIYVHPEDRKRLIELLENRGFIEGFEAEHYTKDGSTIWVSMNARVVRDKSGEIIYYESTSENITERKRAEDELKKTLDNLRQGEEILSATVNSIHDSLIMIDRSGNVLLANITVAKRIGKKAGELLGTYLYDNFSDEVAKLRKEKFDSVFATGNPVHFEDERNGVYYENYAYPVLRGENEISRIVIFARDITKGKLAEEALKKSEENYRSIFENAAEGIFQTTPEGRLVSLNPAMARMHGFASAEEMLKEISSINEQLILRAEDGKRYIRTLLKEGKARQFETEVRRRDGGIIWVSINARVINDAAGKIIRYEGTTEDITEQKKAEEDLKISASKLRKSLIGTINVISIMLETRDPYTAGHQRRVSSLARSMAQELGLHSDVIDSVRMAGNIHDIGKISVPGDILVKPGKLSDMEMSLMKMHPQTGHDILKVVDLPPPIAEIILQHHERLDGSGYPQGLKGEQIILEAQIIAVADVVEAMASHRPYRPSRGIEAALDEIEKNRGILYHHDVVDVCLRLFREKGFAFGPNEK